MKEIIKQCVGIDVSQKQIDVTFGTYALDQSIIVEETKRFRNDPKAFTVFLKWAMKRAKPEVPLFFVMEATGVYHEKLAVFLSDQEQKVSVIHPSRASSYAKTMEVKTITDKEASRTLTRMGLEKKLKLWHKPDPMYLALQHLSREREQLQKAKTALSNQMHASQVSAFKSLSKTSKKLIKTISEHIKVIESAMQEYVRSNPELERQISYMTSIPGVGLITAASVLGETNGFREIKNKRQLVSYAGLDVIRKDSGTSVISKPRISKKGNAHIRKALYFPALTAIKYDQKQKDKYIRLVQTHGIKMKAAVAIQRKLLICMYVLWKKNQMFNKNYEPQNVKKIGQPTPP